MGIETRSRITASRLRANPKIAPSSVPQNEHTEHTQRPNEASSSSALASVVDWQKPTAFPRDRGDAT